MKRIFIAAEVIPEKEFIRILSLLKETLENEKIKWVDLKNTHITLAFLGDTEADKIRAIGKMLKEKCDGSGRIEFKIQGLGVFKNLRDPGILWAGIEASMSLVRLYEAIKEGLNDCDIQTEDRNFKPHLTLGRIKQLKNTEAIKKLLDEYHNTEIQKVIVNEIILYESILLPAGPVYKPVHKFSLK